MPRRRAGLAIVAICLTSLATLVAAQVIALPDCALRCVTISATATCNIDNYACVCRSFSGPVRSCITNICSGSQGLDDRDSFDLQCENVGVPIAGGATHTTTTTKPPADPDPTPTPTPTPSSPTSDSPDPPGDSSTSPPSTGTRTPNDPADTAGTATHSSSDVNSTGSSGAQPSGSNPSDANVTNPPNGANTNGEDSDSGGGSSIGSLVGAIVGGLVGGLLVVALVWFILRRRRRQLEDYDGVVAYSMSRSDNMSYINEPKRDSSQPILMGHLSPSSHKPSTSGSGFSPVTGSPSPHSSPAPAGYIRGPGSTSDSDGTYAARPFVANDTDQYIPRKGDPPRILTYATPSSIAPESVAGSSSRSNGAGPADVSSPIRGPDDSASVALSSASAQELTPEQLNLVQTMVNRGLPGAAVVDVIQRMLVDNQAVPPEYRPDAGGTLPPPLTPGLGPPPPITPGLPPPPLTPAPPASTGSGSSTRLPYRQPRS